MVGLAAAGSAHGLSFSFNYSQAVMNNPNFANIQMDLNYVANEYSSLFSDPITIFINVDQTTTGLGGSSSEIYSPNTSDNYTIFANALKADAKTADDAIAVANLPATDPYANASECASFTIKGCWYATTAEAKALGLIGANSEFDSMPDGTFDFNVNQPYTYDPNNRQVPGQFDFIGVAEHEISEIMGRVTAIEEPNFGYDLLDTMRYTSPGNRNVNPSQCGVYFSFDSGISEIAGYNCNPSGDLQDYDGVTPGPEDPYNAFTSSGQGHMLTSADIRNLDVIGYDRTSPAPEPAPYMMMSLGLAGLGLLRRRLAR
jgi:hypothetical protein